MQTQTCTLKSFLTNQDNSYSKDTFTLPKEFNKGTGLSYLMLARSLALSSNNKAARYYLNKAKELLK